VEPRRRCDRLPVGRSQRIVFHQLYLSEFERRKRDQLQRDGVRHCYGNDTAYAESDGDCHGNAYANSDGNSNSHSNGDCDRTATSDTNAPASADTAASPLAFFGIRGTRENDLASSQPPEDRLLLKALPN